MENESLFSVSESGEIEYNSENEVLVDGTNENDAVDSTLGNSVSGQESSSEVSSQDEVSMDDAFSPDTGVLPSDSAVAVYAVDAPVSGTMSSTTLDYFDRVVDGLPSDFGYVAYKTSNDDSYAGSLVYGRDYSVNGNSIVFGEGAVELVLSRYNYGNYNYYLQYDSRNASNTSLSLPSSGTLLYYTNLVDGRPILGKGNRPFEIAPYITVALLAVLASCVLGRILKR